MVKVAVIGAGLMGVKIAGEMAYHGHRVKIYDTNVNSLNTVYERVQEDKKYLRQEGLLASKNFIGQILCISRLEETVNDADVIFECVVEELQVKQDLFERISHLCRPETVITSNTLRLDIADIVDRTAGKERTLGLRFLFPIYYIPEVEITPGPNTSTGTIDKVRTLLEKMGKTLFFRSGDKPLVLSDEQREERKKVRQDQIKNSSGMTYFFESTLPTLSSSGRDFRLPSTDTDYMLPNPSDDHDCAICMDRPRDCLLCPCHHMITCHECSKMLLNRRDGCPICRKDIAEILRVYDS